MTASCTLRTPILASAPSGLSALASYIGAENATKMGALVNSGVKLDDLSAVDVIRTSIRRGWNAELVDKDVRQINAFLNDNDTMIQKYIPIFGEGLLTGYDLNKPSKERLTSLLAPTVARLQKWLGYSREQAIPLAFSLMFNDPSKIDYVDGTFTEPSPASSFKSMFHEVSKAKNISNQASEDYRTALTNVIDRAMGFDVDKQPDPEVRRRSKSDEFGDFLYDKIVRESAHKQVLGLVRQSVKDRFLSDGSIRKFDASEYQTLSATLVGDGVLQVHRAPLDITGISRPVSVTITAEQVIDELDRIYKRNAEKAKDRRENGWFPRPHK